MDSCISTMHSNVGGNLAFLFLAIGLALCIFAVIRLLSSIISNQVLILGVGILSILALPVCWLYLTYSFGYDPLRTDPSKPLLLVELVVASVCTTLYFYRKWLLPEPSDIALAAIHYGLWGWVFFGPFFWTGIRGLFFCFFGFASTLVWCFYVKRTLKQN
jgi:hypothetical protein